MSKPGTRRVEGAVCCVCLRGAASCAEPHRELRGVVYVFNGQWVCAECARTVAACWARAALAAVK